MKHLVSIQEGCKFMKGRP